MKILALLLLLAFAGASDGPALAQADCPVCMQATKLRDELRKLEISDAAQRARGETLSKEGLALLTAFRDDLPPARQGRRPFEALVALGVYAAPFAPDGGYEKTLAAIAAKDPAYRKRYQAQVRKGMRARDRGASCRMRYLQTNVEVQECLIGEIAKGESEDVAEKHCSASYALEECLAKKR